MKYLVVGSGLCAWLVVACSGSSNVKLAEAGGAPGLLGSSGSSGSSLVTGSAGSSGVSSGGASGCGSNADCTVGVCSSGVCKDVTCVPNTTFCSGEDVTQCGPNGAQLAVAEHCASGSYCLEKANSASCSPTVCFAGDPLCVGSVATQCEPDGSGPKPGGVDCTKTKQSCYAGECRDQLCTPGQKLCDNGSLYLCAEAGTSRGLIIGCNTGQVCDATQGACKPKICDPGQLSCDATRVVACNSAGSAWLQTDTDCATKSSACVAGSCIPVVCQANTKSCKDNNVVACNSQGTSQTLNVTCGTSSRCFENSGYAYCSALFCDPGQPVCNGNLLATCNADGSGYMTGGTDCTLTGALCSDAQCKPGVCTPYQRFCKDGNVQQCNDGFTFSQAQYCAQGTYCLSHSNVVDCSPTPCVPDTDACVGEKLGHCAADGMSVVATADCASQQMVCALSGCAASSVDTLSTANQIATASASELLGNVVFVQAARKLTLIEADISMSVPRMLNWVVFEGTNADLNGEFDLKFQKTTTGTGTGFQSSGAIAVELEAGKTYLIGVTAADGSYVYYYDSQSAPLPMNFGHVIGSVDTYYSSGGSFDGYYQPIGLAYHQRLTSSAP